MYERLGRASAVPADQQYAANVAAADLKVLVGVRSKSFADMECSIARSLDQVGSWWALLIVRDAMMGARRFTHFERSLGIAKNTLASRLAQLCDTGILHKVSAADGSAFDEYALTERGRELAPVLIALSQWGDRWVPHPEGPSTEIVEARTGRTLAPLTLRSHTGDPLSMDAITLRRAERRPALHWERPGKDDDPLASKRDDQS